MEDFITEKKLRKLLPIVERLVSKKYGQNIKLKDLTVCGVTVYRKDCAK